jgi:hypothetical protein
VAKPENKSENRYKALLETVFFEKFRPGATRVPFVRGDLERVARELGIKLPKNLGDAIYSARYRTRLPETILTLQPEGMEWVIEGTGRSQYEFRLVKLSRIVPNPSLAEIKIPDATPEIVTSYALSDEQALLAKVRYNRLLDVFLGLPTYSLQNHLRTTVVGIGQVEIDEIYVGLDKHGCQYIVPVQAKSGKDILSTVQARQDIACCAEKFPRLICRAVSAQFVEQDLIALFELTTSKDAVKIAEERHYRLVSADEISDSDLAGYRVQRR